MHCAILTRQIGHYHNARFRAAAARFSSVTVISCAGEGYFSEFSAKAFDGYVVRTLSESRTDYSEKVKSGDFMNHVISALNEVRPDIVVAPGWASAESFAALMWARDNKVPSIVMAESQQDDADRAWSKELIKSHVVRQFDAGIAGGRSTKSYLVELGLPAEYVTLGYNAVDNAHFAKGAKLARSEPRVAKKKHGLPERFFLASGRFIEKKNFPELVRAYAVAHASAGVKLPDLIILGDGAERPSISRAITETGMADHIRLVGYCDYDILPIYYGLSEGFVHIPTREQWGLVINEAMAAGVPVIVSTCCGATRTLLRAGKGGFKVDPSNRSEISSALVRLALLTSKERATISDDARDAVADWGPERFGRGLVGAAKFALKRPRRPPLRAWDRALLRRMGRRVFTDVE